MRSGIHRARVIPEDGPRAIAHVRQLRDMKFSVPLVNVISKELARYVTNCGAMLTQAHAKSGDAAAIAAIAGHLGKSDAFDSALEKFARACANRTRQDYAALLKTIETGRAPAIVDS